MIEPGTILQNRYLLTKQIGQGGMGTVYVATDQRFGSTVAVKETFFDDPNLRKAFEREARLLNSLRHGALPRVSDHFVEDDGQFLVMEFISGDDLSALLEKNGGPFPVDRVLGWAEQLLDALEYLHDQTPPIIHRDIKPQNLKLTERDHVILLDFGLAKGAPSNLSRVTNTGSVFGYSRSYAPLEQIQGAGTDTRSDLYSLAATLYHLLTGVTPPDAVSRATAVINGQADPMRPAAEVNPRVSADISNVLTRALAQNANQRPASAREMRHAFQTADRTPGSGAGTAAIAGQPTIFDQPTQLLAPSTRPLSDAAGLTDIGAAKTVADGGLMNTDPRGAGNTGGTSMTVVTPPASGAGRYRWLAAAAGIVVLCGLAFGLYRYLSQPETAPPATESNRNVAAPAAATPTPAPEASNPKPAAEEDPSTAPSPKAKTGPTKPPSGGPVRETQVQVEEPDPDGPPPPRLDPNGKPLPPPGRRAGPPNQDPNDPERIRDANERRRVQIQIQRDVQRRRQQQLQQRRNRNGQPPRPY